MKTPLHIMLLLTIVCNISFSQEVKTKFTAIDLSEIPHTLDSISLYNIDNGSSKTIYPLPGAWGGTYEIDFITGNVYGIENYLSSNNGIYMISNLPGKFIFSASSYGNDKLILELYTTMGQIYYKYEGMMNAGINTYELTINRSQVYIVRVLTPMGAKSFKVFGDDICGSTEITYKGFVEESQSTKSTYTPKLSEEWSFMEGDWVKITAHLSGYNSDYYETIPINGADDTIYITIPCPDEPYVIDYDGNVYGTVLIGNKCWMRENLRSTHYADGTPIDEDKMVVYEFNDEYEKIYGRLYTQNAIVRGQNVHNYPPIQGICPEGWLAPYRTDWQWDLLKYLGLDPIYFSEFPFNNVPVGMWFKSKDALYWEEPNIGANNRSGMYFLPSGYAMYNENLGWTFHGIKKITQICTSSGFIIEFKNSDDLLDTYNYDQYKAGCVRCMKHF